MLSLSFFLAFLAVSVLLSVLLSIAAILLEEYAVRRHERGRDIARLVLLRNGSRTSAIRQLTAFFRCLGAIDLVRGRGTGASMQRRGLESRAEAPLPPEQAGG